VIYDRLTKSLDNLVPINANLVELAATGLGDTKLSKEPADIRILQKEFSGANSRDKVVYVRQKMAEHNCDCYVLTALDEIAYLLNSISLVITNLVRGNDLKFNPLVYSFLVFLPDEIFLFIDDPNFWHV
jgi:Xaa-Pro aminopeptidase